MIKQLVELVLEAERTEQQQRQLQQFLHWLSQSQHFAQGQQRQK